MEMPSRRKQSMVERQSAPLKKPVTSVVPSASEPNITVRWEMDLSPGMVTSPCNFCARVNFINVLLTVPGRVGSHIFNQQLRIRCDTSRRDKVSGRRDIPGNLYLLPDELRLWLNRSHSPFTFHIRSHQDMKLYSLFSI